MPTACVIHAYLALVWMNLRPADLEDDSEAEDRVVSILGSLAFVRNWHGFGMGTLRSNMLGAGNSENGVVRADAPCCFVLLRVVSGCSRFDVLVVVLIQAYLSLCCCDG